VDPYKSIEKEFETAENGLIKSYINFDDPDTKDSNEL